MSTPDPTLDGRTFIATLSINRSDYRGDVVDVINVWDTSDPDLSPATLRAEHEVIDSLNVLPSEDSEPYDQALADAGYRVIDTLADHGPCGGWVLERGIAAT